jgi:hypothetical protein
MALVKRSITISDLSGMKLVDVLRPPPMILAVSHFQLSKSIE